MTTKDNNSNIEVVRKQERFTKINYLVGGNDVLKTTVGNKGNQKTEGVRTLTVVGSDSLESQVSVKEVQKPVRDMEEYKKEGYYITFDSVRFDFGGAFLRLLSASYKAHKEEINELLFKTQKIGYKVMQEQFGLSGMSTDMLFNKDDATIKESVEMVMSPFEEPQYIADMFDDKETLILMPSLITAVITVGIPERHFYNVQRKNFWFADTDTKEIYNMMTKESINVLTTYDKMFNQQDN